MRCNSRNGGGRGGRGREGREGRGGRGCGHGISAVHNGRADQEETKEDNNDGRGAGAGMSRRRRNYLLSSTNTLTNQCELDSQADTCAFDPAGCCVLSTSSQSINDTGFHNGLKINDVQIGNVCLAFDCPFDHRTYCLHFCEVLLIPGLGSHLLSVDQLRANNVVVNDVPLIRLRPEQRNREAHAILTSGLRIPLLFDKPISYFTCRQPTDEEINDIMEFQPIWMTADIPWQPYDPDSRRQEEALRQQIDADYQAPYHQLASFTRLDSTLPTAACLDRLPQVLGDSNNVVCGVHSLTIRSMKTSGKSYLIKPDQLAR
ncbi:unnamed protein product [Cylindrotheca closterium]|uniref:Uncharacterized protein n=1 Tax=Cylindrotheca closterium TaxID=2856 RepID=A0AAD2G8G5_9STRA|nr:unnamed protein product [Cylindrotheca closterium]